IILASRSKARRKLLKGLGFKFTVSASNIKEDHVYKRNLRKLVIKNALAKAKDAAKNNKTAIIIAADTVVQTGKKLIGKPKNTDDAITTIRLLSKKPHWVYSGLAVIDARSGKTFTASEKTKVFMSKLSKKESEDYCRRYLPLDKAGSFDIQGPGAMFIERIEGCYYNVVGLPLAKLVKILKKLQVRLLDS
ncbi:MAG: septum formation protein Maf, partial [Candidatus Omnitrophica bacterium]|nr:septum formation protein Maf [Candidatus Omnitrophota bacterium]